MCVQVCIHVHHGRLNWRNAIYLRNMIDVSGGKVNKTIRKAYRHSQKRIAIIFESFVLGFRPIFLADSRCQGPRDSEW